MSRIEAGRTVLEEEVFDLRYLVDSVVEMFRLRAQGQGLILSCTVEAAVPRFVRADEGKLRQILINLLSNAVKFTEAGSVTLHVTPTAGGVRFEISDTGPGIAQDEQAQLFEAFVQTSAGRSTRRE